MGQDSARRQDTSAGRACAAIEAFLAEQKHARSHDWQALLSAICNQLAQLCATDLIAGDQQAQTIIAGMVSANDMEELDCQVDLLAQRVAQLLRSARAADDAGLLPMQTPGSNRHSPLSRTSNGIDGVQEDPSARSFLRL